MDLVAGVVRNLLVLEWSSGSQEIVLKKKKFPLFYIVY